MIILWHLSFSGIIIRSEQMSSGTRTTCVCSGAGHDRVAALLWELLLLPQDVSMYQKRQEGKGKRNGVRTQKGI